MSLGSRFQNPWFFPLRPINSGSLLRVFFFHYSGGSASQFRLWSKDLTDVIDPIGIQLPGRENRFGEALYFDSSEALEDLIKVFPNVLDKPFILFGHSMGAALAFELARILRRKSYSFPQHLIVSGRGAAHLSSCNKQLYNLPKKEFIEELIKYNGLPEEVLRTPELLDLFLPIIRADFSISDTCKYVPEMPLSCPITALGGMRDPYALEDDIKEWKLHTASSFSYHMFKGDHFFLLKESLLEVVKCINQIAFETLKKIPNP